MLKAPPSSTNKTQFQHKISILPDCWSICPRLVIGHYRSYERRRLQQNCYCCYSTHSNTLGIRRFKEKGTNEGGVPVVGILGATCTGKSKLSIDIGTRFPSEVVNADKMQLYNGLDITTNQMLMIERKGIPHHLLAEFGLSIGEITPTDFRSLASTKIDSIQSRQKIPIIVGGSNSFFHALLSENHVPDDDPFVVDTYKPMGGIDYRLKYRFCRLLWVDVEWTVLKQCIDKRVDVMVEMGMVEELESYFDLKRATEKVYRGLDKSIGVPEMDKFFLQYPPQPSGGWKRLRIGEKERYEEAIEDIKRNTRILARRQVEKINILRDVYGWDLLVLDATEAVRRKMEGMEGMGKDKFEEAWDRDVMRPAMEEMEVFIGP